LILIKILLEKAGHKTGRKTTWQT